MADRPTPVARRGELTGRVTKTLRVPEGCVAVVRGERGPATLQPGDHRVAAWPAPAPEALLVAATPLPLELAWAGVPAGDGCAADVTLAAEARVVDPLRLGETWLRGGGPEWPLPADALAGRLAAEVEAAVRQYAAADLGRPAVTHALAGRLRDPLTRELGRYGLSLATPALAIRATSADARLAADANARAAAELARQNALDRVFADLDTLDMFRDRLAAWEEQTGQKLDAATAAALWRRLAPADLPLPPAATQAALDATAIAAAEAVPPAAPALPAARQHAQLVGRMGGEPLPAADLPSDHLNNLYRYLRLGAAAVGVAWAGRTALTHGFARDDMAGLFIETFGLLVASVGLGAAAVTYRSAQAQAAPYWRDIEAQLAGLPGADALARARGAARRSSLAADALIVIALVSGLLLWLANLPPALLIGPLLLFLAAIGLTLAARRRERAARAAVDGLLAEVVHPTLPERRAADDLLRRRIAEHLARVERNLDAATAKVYARGDAGLALGVALRDLRQRGLAEAQAAAEQVAYRAGRYLTAPFAAEDAVTRAVELDADLLRRAEQLALDSEALYAAAVDGDLPACAEALPALDKALNRFTRLLGERNAFIQES